ncbi:MFS transporter [Streptomyces roseus]|uniref:MFS transporter n=1 Tax=Streptomyces roseus TaxID=66430 RepID=UPI00381731F4
MIGRRGAGKNGDRGSGGGGGGGGLAARLRHPPGGRDARIMLFAQLLDRTGTGVWGASCVLFFTFVAGLDGRRLGLLLGAAGVAGIAGSPLAGHLAARFRVRTLLIGCHLLRLAAIGALLVFTRFQVLLLLVAVTSLGDRAAKMLEMLFATRAAGEQRGTYQALSRSVANAGYALGAGLAAIGLAVGTREAYQVLILANGLSFVLAAALVWRTGEQRDEGGIEGGSGAGEAVAGAADPGKAVAEGPDAVKAGGLGEPGRAGLANPWRDRGYLRFVLLDIPLCLDDSILGVGLPLWLIEHTDAPHAVVPAFLIINTVLVVVLQMTVSARVGRPRQAAGAARLYGLTLLGCCLLLAFTPEHGAWAATLVLLAAAVLVTAAELLRSVSSWELAVSLAPPEARASYLGVAGMSQSIQKSAGPMLLTGAVMVAGPAGWLVLGAAVAGVSVAQRHFALRRLDALPGPDTRGSGEVAGAGPAASTAATGRGAASVS